MSNNIPEQFQNDPSAPFNEEEVVEITEPDDFTGADGSEER